MTAKAQPVPLLFSLPLLGALFLHLIGESMVIPVLVPLLADPQPGGLDMLPGAGAQMRRFLYGVALGAYPVFVFLCAPVIGALSDTLGRRPVLLCMTALSIASCAMQGAGVELLSLPLFLVARSLMGVSAGVDGVIQAALVERCSTQSQKDFYLGATLSAMSLGFIIGPAFAAAFIGEDSSALAWSMPFFICSALFCACLAFMFFKLPSSEARVAALHFKDLTRGFTDIVKLLQLREARGLLLLFLLTQVAGGCFSTVLPLILNDSYGFTPRMLAAFISLGGVFAGLTFAFTGPRLLRVFSACAVLRASVLVCCAVLALTLLDLGRFVWAIAPALSLGFPLAYYAMLTMFSLSADDKKRGWLLSVLSALWGLTMGIGMVLCGAALFFGNFAAVLISICLALAALFIPIRSAGPTP